MLSLLADLDPSSYTHRTYVISSGDDFSASKAVDFEHHLTSPSPSPVNAFSGGPCETSHGPSDVDAKSTSYSLHFVPRARKIHQSLLTAPISCLQCFFACIRLLYSPSLPTSSMRAHSYPDLILLNGPSNSVLVLLAALFLRFFALSGTSGKMRSIYVESWARVNGLSLSGKILVTLGAVDRFLVQWERLAEKGNGEYRGCLVR
ncbi:UDP-N-acetylglucosamine transferase subunit [Pseudocyphellaria aurata]|nr:UDP-N-acetylglucosamine transferase subunit [Pseudocyphellaria aurata]